MSEADKQAVSAGRGVAYIAAAKMYFMVAGAAIEFLLPRLLGKYAFGAYGVVAQWVSAINNVMVTGTIQAVSRRTTAEPGRADDVKAAGLRMQLMVGLPLAALYAALAPLWAHLEHDPGKAGLMALSGAILAAYSLYSVFVGSANGSRAFHKQAALDMMFATLRAGLILGAAIAGLKVWGAIGAWAAAAVAILAISAVLIGVPRHLRAGRVGPMVEFLGGLALYLVIINLIMAADQLLLKRLSAEWFHGHQQLDPVAAAHEADGQVAYYRAVQNLARLPYQLMIAVTFVIFPLVSQATFEKDTAKTQRYIRTTMRYSLIFASLFGAMLAARSRGLLDVLYPLEYGREGGLALMLLALGSVAFAIFSIAGTILNGAGRTFEAVVIGAGTLGALVVGLWVAIPRAAPGSPMLTVCAAGTSTAMLCGAVASGVILHRRLGAFLSGLTALRVVLAIAAVVALGHVLPERGKLVTLVEAAACGLVFLILLVVTGELGRADMQAFGRVARRRA